MAQTYTKERYTDYFLKKYEEAVKNNNQADQDYYRLQLRKEEVKTWITAKWETNIKKK